MEDFQLNRPVLIGGSGSSGSSLLAAILDNHPEIACGREMSFFNKHVIYSDYARFQAKLPIWLRKGVPTNGYFLYPGFLMRRESYGLEEEQLIRWSKKAQNLREFVEFLQLYLLQRRAKIYFAEKTPSNCYCFREFVQFSPESRLIHIIRDGRDVVCSLMKRGYNMFQAASVWLYNTSAGLACRDLPQYMELRYEDLVTNPEDTIKRVCLHLGVEYVPSILERNSMDQTPRSGLPSWQNLPTGPISPKSIGRYRQELDDSQLACFYNIRLTKCAARKLGTDKLDTVDVLALLGYSVSFPEYVGYPLRGALEPIIDYLRCTKSLLKHGKGLRAPLTKICLRNISIRS